MLDDIGPALRDGLSLVATFVPTLLLFLVVLLGSSSIRHTDGGDR
jgi:hypothetical protein